jgi:hypothetical protein
LRKKTEVEADQSLLACWGLWCKTSMHGLYTLALATHADYLWAPRYVLPLYSLATARLYGNNRIATASGFVTKRPKSIGKIDPGNHNYPTFPAIAYRLKRQASEVEEGPSRGP